MRPLLCLCCTFRDSGRSSVVLFATAPPPSVAICTTAVPPSPGSSVVLSTTVVSSSPASSVLLSTTAPPASAARSVVLSTTPLPPSGPPAAPGSGPRSGDPAGLIGSPSVLLSTTAPPTCRASAGGAGSAPSSSHGLTISYVSRARPSPCARISPTSANLSRAAITVLVLHPSQSAISRTVGSHLPDEPARKSSQQYNPTADGCPRRVYRYRSNIFPKDHGYRRGLSICARLSPCSRVITHPGFWLRSRPAVCSPAGFPLSPAAPSGGSNLSFAMFQHIAPSYR